MFDRALLLLKSRPWLFAASLSLLLLIGNVISEPNFADPGNWPRQLATLAPLVLVAFASTPAIISGGGGIDLSVGPLAVFVNVLLVEVFLTSGTDSPLISVPAMLAIGIVVGVINGVLVATLRYVPIIATVCTFFILSGLTLEVGPTSQSAGGGWNKDLADMIGPVPGALILMAIPALIWFGLSKTRYHRALYAVGGNDATAYSAGVNVQATRIIAYGLGGLFAAFAGIAITANLDSSSPSAIAFYILVGVTAVALGGIPLFGGRGGLTGAFFGATALYLIQTLLNSLSVSQNWLNIVYGLMLIVAVGLGAAVMLYRPRGKTKGQAA